MSSTQFNTAFNAGFVTSFVEALTSYIQPITAIADEIQSTVKDSSSFTTKSSLGVTSINNVLLDVYNAGSKGLSAIDFMKKLDVLDTTSGLTSAFDSVLGHGVTLYSKIDKLEFEFMNAYGSTAGTTANSIGDLQNMSPGDVTKFYEVWNEFNNTLVESSNDFTNMINANTNAFLGSTGRASKPYADIQKIKTDQIALNKTVGKLADFVKENKNVMIKNGIAFPSPPTSTQFFSALTLYNNLKAAGATLIDDSIKFAGETGIKSTAN